MMRLVVVVVMMIELVVVKLLMELVVVVLVVVIIWVCGSGDNGRFGSGGSSSICDNVGGDSLTVFSVVARLG